MSGPRCRVRSWWRVPRNRSRALPERHRPDRPGTGPGRLRPDRPGRGWRWTRAGPPRLPIRWSRRACAPCACVLQQSTVQRSGHSPASRCRRTSAKRTAPSGWCTKKRAGSSSSSSSTAGAPSARSTMSTRGVGGGAEEAFGCGHGLARQVELARRGGRGPGDLVVHQTVGGTHAAADQRVLVEGVAEDAPEEHEPRLAPGVDGGLVRLHHRRATRVDQGGHVAEGLVVLVGPVARRPVAAARDGGLHHHLAGGEGETRAVERTAIRFHPERRHRGEARVLQVAQVALVQVPAQHGGRVHHRHALRSETVEPGGECGRVVDVVPDAVGHDEIAGGPVHRRVAPHRRAGVDPDVVEGGALEGPIVVEVRELRRGREEDQRPAAQFPMGKWQATWWPGRDLSHLGDLLGAAGLRPRAPGPETAARRGVDGAGRLPEQCGRRPRRLRVGLHGRGEQRRRVVVGRRLVEHV